MHVVLVLGDEVGLLLEKEITGGLVTPGEVRIAAAADDIWDAATDS